MVRRWLQYAILSGLLALLIGCGNKGDKPVAVVGGRVITVQEFETSLAQGKAPNVLKVMPDSMKFAHLESLIQKELKILEAYRLGLDQDSLITPRLDNMLKDRVARKVWDTDVIGFLAPEATIKELFQKQSKEVRIRDLVIRFVKNDTVDTEKDVREIMDRLYDYLKNGAKFDSLARRYSEDRMTGSQGGDRGFLRWGAQSASDELYKTAFKMGIGDISRPFKTNTEYHLIKVEEIKTATQADYETEKPRLLNQLLSQKQNEIEPRRKTVLEQLLKKYNGRFEDNNVKLMIQKINSADAVEDSIRRLQGLRPDMFSNLTSEDTAKALYTYAAGKSLNIGLIVRLLKDVDPMRRPQLKTEEELRMLVERIMLFEIFAHEGHRRNYRKDKAIVEEITNMKEDMMLKRLQYQEIDSKINPTEADLETFFKENGSKYMHPERREIQEIWLTDAKKAQAAIKALKAGKNFNAIANQYNEREQSKKTSGKLGLIRKEQYGNVGTTAFNLKKGEVSELIEMGRNFSIVKVLDIKPPELKTFEEVKFQVRNEVREAQKAQREKEWLERLQKEQHIVRYEDRVKKVFQEETPNN